MLKIPLRRVRQVVLATIALASLASLGLAWHGRQTGPAAAAVVGLAFLSTRRNVFAAGHGSVAEKATGKALPARPWPTPPADAHDADALVAQMLAQGRFALLLRPQIADTLTDHQWQAARGALEETMALVPDGDVLLGRTEESSGEGRAAQIGMVRLVRVAPLFLDRYPVTNRQFYEFVAAGGYTQMSLWEETIWPAVLGFLDRTGQPGPRSWSEGCYPLEKEQHPVVGVSWHEAAAYARWAGKRLPSDPEWVKAAAWPVALSPAAPLQRRYPWGDTMDRRRTNLWGSGPGDTVPVTDFADGVSVGGVYQLIGNVWEWTAGNLRPDELPIEDLVLPTPMRTIRGGAFDTYFDVQATCQFQSGENPLSRRHNIGFRCAVSTSDLALRRAAPAASGCVAAQEPQA